MLLCIVRLYALMVVFHIGVFAAAQELPKQVPPLIGTAKILNDSTRKSSDELIVRLTCPKCRWRIMGTVVPKEQWPEVQTQMEMVSLDLRLGGPSALAESRFVDVTGKPIESVTLSRRLEKDSPVLIAVTGRMPDAYYLQLTREDAIIVILGPRDGAPLPDWLPAKQ